MPIARVPTFRPNKTLANCPDGVDRWVQYTVNDVKSAVNNGNRMLADGLSIPVCWMHDTQAKPVYLSHSRWKPKESNPDQWMAQGWIGNVLHWEYDAEKQEAVAIVDIPNEKEYQQFQDIGRVSPGLDYDFVDELGKKWRGVSVGHIASTPKPKQRNISRITPDKAYHPQLLSHPPGMRLTLSFDSTIRREKMAKDDLTKEPPKKDEVEVPEVAEVEAVPKVEEEAPKGGVAGDVAAWCEVLKKLGIHIDGEPKTMDELMIAAKSAIATKNGGSDTGDEDDAENAPVDADSHSAAQAPPMYMSWAASLEPGQLAFMQRDAESRNRDYLNEIADLAKNDQIDVANRDRLIAAATKVNLSHQAARFYTKDFRFREPAFAAEIAAYKKLPHNRFSKQNIEQGNIKAQTLSHGAAATPEQPKGESATEYLRKYVDQANGYVEPTAK